MRSGLLHCRSKNSWSQKSNYQTKQYENTPRNCSYIHSLVLNSNQWICLYDNFYWKLDQHNSLTFINFFWTVCAYNFLFRNLILRITKVWNPRMFVVRLQILFDYVSSFGSFYEYYAFIFRNLLSYEKFVAYALC